MTLRQALDEIQEMLDGQSYSADLWDILVALRGPDSRDRRIKNATTAVIRTAAFPKQPCLERSVFAHRDTEELAERRRSLFAKKLDSNHFREHVAAAFEALDLKIGDTNGERMGAVMEDIQITPSEIHVGRWWTEIIYRRDGNLQIEQFSGVTEHESRGKAKARVNELMEE